MSSQKIHLLFTGLGAGNIGDEAMFTAFLKHYHLPAGSTVEVWDPSSPVIKTLPQQYQYVDWKDDINSRQSVKSSRAVLLVGGTPVADEWGIDWPLRALADRLRFCHAEGIPVHAVGVGVDSLYDEEARQVFINAFKPITSWTVRSSYCRSALLGLGVPSERIAVAADMAWLFPPDTADRKWAYGFWKSLGVDASKPLLGVNVVNERWSDSTVMKAAIAEALDRIIRETGIQGAFLCNETREGKYFDAYAAREVAGMMKEDAVLVPNEYFTPSQMVALLSFCTITLSQRYHFTVFSILADTVPLSFARGQKMTSLLKDLGEEPVGTMETCDPEYLGDKIKHVLSNRSDIGARRQLSARHLSERAKDNFNFINVMRLKFHSPPKLAALSELNSDRFKEFMEMLNSKARAWGLRTFTDWSKVWEYPWIWFNGLRSLDWSQIKMLDLGSELSPMPWFLASLGATVTLVERDSQWVPTWEHLARETGLKVDWRIVNDERLPFPARSFDVVTSFSVVEHQPDKRAAINEIARVLKPEGLFAISFDVCEMDMGMTFPEWNGRALTMKEFEELVWKDPAFETGGRKFDWNIGDCAEFIKWHQESAPHHNYAVGAAIIQKKAEEYVEPDRIDITMCRNILMPRFDTFGDIVLLQGFIQALLDFLPEARITLLVREGYDQLAALFPERLIWKTTRINPYKKPADIQETRLLLNELINDSYDLVLTTTYNRTWLDDLLAAELISSRRVALGKEQDMDEYLAEILTGLGIELPEQLYDECIPVDERCHETEKYQALWKSLTGKVGPIPRPKLVVPDDVSRRAQEFLAKAGMAGGEFVFCFPAGVANVPLKAWPEDNFAEVIAHLEKKYSLRTLIAGHELEKEIIEQVVELTRKQGATPEVWLGKDGDISLACALIAKCSLYFGNDTGMMHMASALDKPVVAIFGGGTWPRFIPSGRKCHVIVGQMPCFNCGWKCLFGDAPCVKNLPLSPVQEAIELVLQKEKSDKDELSIHEAEFCPKTLNELIQKARDTFEKSEADRAARLEVIQRYERELVETVGRLNLTMGQLNLSNSVLPKISIITPTLDQGDFIENTIRSVIEQRYPNLEYIIIDGGSTDNTLEVIKRFQPFLSYWISEPDNGQAEAINKGFSKATGDIVAWLNSDDTYTEGALWEFVKAVLKYPKADIWVASHHNYIDEHDNVRSTMENVFVSHKEFVKYWKMGGIRVNQPSVFFRRQLVEEVGKIDPHFHYGLDYDFFLRLSRKHRIATINGKWANYRLHQRAKSGTSTGEGFYKFIPEWHLASKRQWNRPFTFRWWEFFISFQFYRPFFHLGQRTSDFISRKQMMLMWLFFWPRFIWHLIRGKDVLPRW